MAQTRSSIFKSTATPTLSRKPRMESAVIFGWACNSANTNGAMMSAPSCFAFPNCSATFSAEGSHDQIDEKMLESTAVLIPHSLCRAVPSRDHHREDRDKRH